MTKKTLSIDDSHGPLVTCDRMAGVSTYWIPEVAAIDCINVAG
jgi:hypothetical protein